MKKQPMSPSTPLLLLLDYDGTLTDFTVDPEKSNISNSIRALLRRLQRNNPVILVSGRYISGLERVSGLRHFPMVGTHGFEAKGLPGGLRFASLSLQRRFKKEAAALWRAIRPLHAKYPGIHIERKPYSSTLHYRGIPMSPSQVRNLHLDFGRVFRSTVTHRLWTLQDGKKMIEAMPKGFSKGKAVLKILNRFPGRLPIYAGDDITDISVFKVLGKKGLRVAVGKRIPERWCDIRFKNPREFLQWLAQFDAKVKG